MEIDREYLINKLKRAESLAKVNPALLTGYRLAIGEIKMDLEEYDPNPKWRQLSLKM